MVNRIAIFGVFVCVGLYLIAALSHLVRFTTHANTKKICWMSTALPALLIHVFLLYGALGVSGSMFNVSPYVVLSAIFWLTSGYIVLQAMRKPIESLGLLVFPCAALAVLLVYFFPGVRWVPFSWVLLLHVGLGIVCLSILFIAALLAFFVAAQDRQLRRKTSMSIVSVLPPLQTMEAVLFETVWIGFSLLTLVLASSFYFFTHKTFSSGMVHQTSLALFAWFVFAVLLVGRHVLGWRGARATYGTFFGVLLSFSAYLSSQFV